MFKVICINEGKQLGNPKAIFGNYYTVTDKVYGRDVPHPDSDAIFYKISELNPDRVYHCKLFSPLSEIDEMELVEKEMACLK